MTGPGRATTPRQSLAIHRRFVHPSRLIENLGVYEMRQILPAAMVLLATTFVWAGCAEESDPPPYDISVSTLPAQLLPGQPAQWTVTVLDSQDAAVTGATVAVLATLGDATVDLGTLSELGDGKYFATGVILDATGTWELVVDIDGPEGIETLDEELDVTCDGSGEAGSVCCDPTACGAGLACVYGSCSEPLAGTADGCYDGSECDSGVCTDWACAAPACDDLIVNGLETDLDCGGHCDGCDVGQMCLGDTDCGSNQCEEGACASSVPLLGNGTHSMDNVVMEVVGTAAMGLNSPTDVAINPDATNEIWVTNQGTHSVTVIWDPGTAGQTSKTYKSGGSQHFLARPSSLAFGQPGVMATIHEEDDYTQGPGGTPKDFMGPTLWATSHSVFDGGHGGHLDMLHNSPNGMGIAWEEGNTYWVFDGWHSSLTRYAFMNDHGAGGSYHGDGILWRYAEGQVKRSAGVPSHMEVDLPNLLLYVCDTGHNRIAVLDMTSGTIGNPVGPNYDGTTQSGMNGAVLTTLVDGAAIGMQKPSGLVIDGDVIYVSDNGTSQILAFDKATGELLEWLDTGLPSGSLMGMALSDTGELYVVDGVLDGVMRITAKTE